VSRVLVVDDDPHIRELVRAFLRHAGFEVDEAANGVEALAALEAERVDLVIVDVMMPELDGWELCRRLRERYDYPVLMLTARGEPADRLRGFELGSDDYLVKPFEPLELVARAQALLRRYRIATSQTVSLGTLWMDHRTFEVTVGGEAVTLPRKEFELLFKLAGSPGRTYARDQLIEDIWGSDYQGNERTLDVHVSRLRERFPEEQHGFRIRTIRGLGYRIEPVP